MWNGIVFGVYGHSDSGKTTLIVKLVNRLSKEGYRVATVKCTNKSVSLDTKGKDTWRHQAAGAGVVILSSPKETDFLVHSSLSMSKILQVIWGIGDYDVVLIEGAHDPDIPKIQVGTGKKRKHTIATYTDNFHEIIQMVTQEIESKKPPRQLTICVDGKVIPLTEFPEHILTNTIVGMLSSLKGVHIIHEASINFKR